MWLIVVALVGTACQFFTTPKPGTPFVAQSAVQDNTATSLKQQGNKLVGVVTCPSDLGAVVGQKMTCHAQINGADRVVLLVVTGVRPGWTNWSVTVQ